MCDLKATKVNMQRSLIRELGISEFELDYNAAAEATKNIYCSKNEGTVDDRGSKNFTWVTRSTRISNWRRTKTVDSEAVLQSIEANLASSTRRVSGELSISQSCMLRHFHQIDKNILSYRIVPHVLPKYCKTFDSL